jgi:hypothetical protein
MRTSANRRFFKIRGESVLFENMSEGFKESHHTVGFEAVDSVFNFC